MRDTFTPNVEAAAYEARLAEPADAPDVPSAYELALDSKRTWKPTLAIPVGRSDFVPNEPDNSDFPF